MEQQQDWQWEIRMLKAKIAYILHDILRQGYQQNGFSYDDAKGCDEISILKFQY